MLDSKTIETLSANAVKNSIVTSEFLDQYISDRADLESMLQCDSFRTGFRLGVQLMLAACKKV